MEALDITTIPTNDLGEFITSYMDREGVQSEYIGRLVKKEGHLGQEIDEGFMHNFNAKQLRAVKDNPVYAKYVERESKKKTLQLKRKKVDIRDYQPFLLSYGRIFIGVLFATKSQISSISSSDTAIQP
jgi:hypothetical protein